MIGVLVAAALLALLVWVGWVCFRRIEQSWAAPAAPAVARSAAARQPPPRQDDGGWLPPGEEGHLAAAVAFEDAMVRYREECERRADAAAAATAARPERRLPAVIDVGPGTQI